MKNFMKVTPYDIFRHFAKTMYPDFSQYTFHIAGDIGPTGKTWLTKQLRGFGFNAIELTQGLWPYLKVDEYNHVIIDNLECQVLIILNRRLPEQLWHKNGG